MNSKNRCAAILWGSTCETPSLALQYRNYQKTARGNLAKFLLCFPSFFLKFFSQLLIGIQFYRAPADISLFVSCV